LQDKDLHESNYAIENNNNGTYNVEINENNSNSTLKNEKKLSDEANLKEDIKK